MNQQQLNELLLAVRKLADSADAIAKIMVLYVRTETDPVRHAMYMRILNAMRDAALSLRHTLSGAPTLA
jgi:hypothetical protein